MASKPKKTKESASAAVRSENLNMNLDFTIVYIGITDCN